MTRLTNPVTIDANPSIFHSFIDVQALILAVYFDDPSSHYGSMVHSSNTDRLTTRNSCDILEEYFVRPMRLIVKTNGESDVHVYVLTGTTESGDDIGPYVWMNKPTDEDMMKVLRRDLFDDVEAETADLNHCSLHEVYVEYNTPNNKKDEQ